MLKIEQKPVVGAYHKTGTVLLKEIFTEYCKKSGLRIVFEENFHKIKSEDLINKKSLAIIRHPYEIVVSGVRYHSKGTEKWLHGYRPMNDGKTYFEKINQIDNMEEKINFEAKFCSYKIIQSIYKDIQNKKQTLFIKLENFWTIESRIDVANQICEYMNLNIDILMPIILKKSQKKHNATNQSFCHTWPKILTQKNIEFIDSLIPKDTFKIFGYKKSHEI